MNKVGYARVREKQGKVVLALVKAQLFAAALVIIGCCIYSGISFSLSAALGSLASILPNLCFAYYSLRRQGANARHNMLASVYVGEILKFVLVICLLIISYRVAGSADWLSTIGILIGFSFTYLSVLFMPLLVK